MSDQEQDQAQDDQTPTSPSMSPSSPENSTNTSIKPSHISWSDSYTKAYAAVEALSSVLPSIPHALSITEHPAITLLHDPDFAAQVSRMLRQPNSGAVNDNLCGWLYDAFQSSEPDLHLVVLRFLPILAGVYLSRATLNKPLAGFESVLLAIYASETAARNGQAVSASIPDLSHSSIYHETKQVTKNSSTELHLAVITPSLDPHGTVRSTRRARIVGVALELYFSKISLLPIGSKIEFCEFCKIWSGTENVITVDQNSGLEETRRGRIDMPWEILQPVLRILGHCLIYREKDENGKLVEAAMDACRCMEARALHDINPKAILAIGSLLKLAKMATDSANDVDHTEIIATNVITV